MLVKSEKNQNIIQNMKLENTNQTRGENFDIGVKHWNVNNRPTVPEACYIFLARISSPDKQCTISFFGMDACRLLIHKNVVPSRLQL